MRFKSLSELKRPEPEEVILDTLPQAILMTNYARAKAFSINALVRRIHRSSYEWYGYTIAALRNPEVVVDIGIPFNDKNFHQYTGIEPENIANYRESLPADAVINGWIHSHGNLQFRQFSRTDERNHQTVLDYVSTILRKPVAKRRVPIRDMTLLVDGQFDETHLTAGNVSVVTDHPVSRVQIMETLYGSFCYGIVVGDGGWHRQEVHYRRRGILTGHTTVSKREAEIVLMDDGKRFTESDMGILVMEVRDRIRSAKIQESSAGK